MAISTTFPFDSSREDRFSPSYDGNSYTNADRVQKIQFGDGYIQYIRDGANWQKHTFQYKWNNVEFTPLDKLSGTINIPAHGDCVGIDYPDGNIIFQFMEDVRTIKPFLFKIPKLGITKQVRCTGYSIEHASFDTVNISISMETDYTLG